jgi:hypothetical protein
MLRSAVNVLLVFGLLFTQLATAPHVHGAELHHTSPHGSQPHFHLHQFFPPEKVGVSSGEPVRNPDGVPPRVGHNCPYDHDADAFYLPDTSGEPGRAKADADAKPLPAVLPCVVAAGASSDGRIVLSRTFDARPPGRPLYIRHLALLN